jgi:hypothetical protein
MTNFLVFFSYNGKIPAIEYELLQSFAFRLKSIHPEARLVILSDPSTAKFLTKVGFEVFMGQVSRETLLLDRLKIFRAFLEMAADNSYVVLIDYDIILNRKLTITDRVDFDVAYTFRNRARSFPLNGGLVGARANIASRDFFAKVLEAYASLSPDKLPWWGDQIGVWEVASQWISEPASGIFKVGPTALLLLDAEEYNWTPFDMDVSPTTLTNNMFLSDDLAALCAEKAVVHFKGPRKHLQIQYFNYIETNHSRRSHPRARSPQCNGISRELCILRLHNGNCWSITNRHGETAFLPTFESALREASSSILVHIFLTNEMDPCDNEWFGLSYLPPSIQPGLLVDAPLNTISDAEVFAALALGILPASLSLSGAVISDAIRDGHGHITLRSVLIYVAAKMGVRWSGLVAPNFKHCDFESISCLDLAASIVSIRQRHFKSFLIYRLASISGLQITDASLSSIHFSDCHTATHRYSDEADFNTILALEAKLLLKLMKKTELRYSEILGLAIERLKKLGDFRAKLLDEKKYSTIKI